MDVQCQKLRILVPVLFRLLNIKPAIMVKLDAVESEARMLLCCEHVCICVDQRDDR